MDDEDDDEDVEEDDEDEDDDDDVAYIKTPLSHPHKHTLENQKVK